MENGKEGNGEDRVVNMFTFFQATRTRRIQRQMMARAFAGMAWRAAGVAGSPTRPFSDSNLTFAGSSGGGAVAMSCPTQPVDAESANTPDGRPPGLPAEQAQDTAPADMPRPEVSSSHDCDVTPTGVGISTTDHTDNTDGRKGSI